MGILQNVSREYTTINTFRGLQKWTKALGPDRTDTVADDLESAIDAHARRIAFRFEGHIATYAELDARANGIAHWALSQGMTAGDTVALFMENRPDYVAVWYGLSKVGVITSLINTNLEGEGLRHCIETCGATHVVTGAEQDDAVRGVLETLEARPTLWTLGGRFGYDLENMLGRLPDNRPDRLHREHLRGKDTCLYVYTSGTTGLPKAAKLSQLRLATMMRSFIAPCNVTDKDSVYVPLPLYHATGGVCAIGIALLTGATIVLRRKFSASGFWDDCADNDVSVFVYIGELCRYLINQPEHRKERAHNVRVGFGNGLSGDIWQKFSDRFGIPKLVEFYASTEGNVRYMNVDGKVGAVGRVPPYLKFAFDHIAIVKFDPATEKPVRDAEGRCVLAAHNEAGEAIGRVGQDGRSSFDGYKDSAATEQKVLVDVFEDDDRWFRTGDLLKQDADGYVYFVDRIGDTFRWKGENVSTQDVAAALCKQPGIATANVYGVKLPNTEGRAGMAAVTLNKAVQFENLYGCVRACLPAYAMPIFLRVESEAATTGTFKFRKTDLVEQGFDPAKTGSEIWYLDAAAGQYRKLTADAFTQIETGAIQF